MQVLRLSRAARVRSHTVFYKNNEYKMKPRDILTALFVALLLGGNFVVIKIGVREVPPLLLTGLRFFFAAVPAVFFIQPPRTAVRHVLSFGILLGVVQFGLLFTAIHLGMPAGLSSVVLQMQVFFTIAMGRVFFGDRLSALQLAGGLIAALGIAAIGAFQSGGTGLLPFLLVLGSALAWALANLVTKAAGSVNMLAFVVWGSLAAPLPLFVLSYLIEGPAAIRTALGHPTWMAGGIIAFLAYPATLLGFGLWSKLIGRYPVATVAPFALLVPVTGLLAARLALHEAITPVALAGSILVLLGMILNLGGMARRHTSSAPPR